MSVADSGLTSLGSVAVAGRRLDLLQCWQCFHYVSETEILD